MVLVRVVGSQPERSYTVHQTTDSSGEILYVTPLRSSQVTRELVLPESWRIPGTDRFRDPHGQRTEFVMS